jgi:hypothetical protein
VGGSLSAAEGTAPLCEGVRGGLCVERLFQGGVCANRRGLCACVLTHCLLPRGRRRYARECVVDSAWKGSSKGECVLTGVACVRAC